MLEGFCKDGILGEAKTLFESMQKVCDFINLESCNILICGCWVSGFGQEWKALKGTVVGSKRDGGQGVKLSVYSYNIVMDGLCKNGMLSDARMVIRLMKSSGIPLDTVTYSTLLHEYCSKGRFSKANNIGHEMMTSICLANPYTCNILLHSL